MIEFILLFIFFYLVFNSFSKRKAKRNPRSLAPTTRESFSLESLTSEPVLGTPIAVQFQN